MSLLNQTPEQRADALAKAKAARELLKANAHLYKQDFVDLPYWRTLATKHKITMPTYYQPADAKQGRKCLKKLGKGSEWLSENMGLINAGKFFEMNPTWPAYAFMGLCLEQVEEEANSA